MKGLKKKGFKKSTIKKSSPKMVKKFWKRDSQKEDLNEKEGIVVPIMLTAELWRLT